MKESFLTPLILAIAFVGLTLGVSSFSTKNDEQVAQVVSSTQGTPSLPVTYAVAVSSDVVCTGASPQRTVGFFSQPVEGGYFSMYGAGGVDLGDKEPGLYELPVGTYTWEGIPRAGYMRSGTYAGTFTISGACSSLSQATATDPILPPSSPSTGTEDLPSNSFSPVRVTVSAGGACLDSKRMTPVAVSIEPRGARVIISKANGNVVTTITQGLAYLPNGAYTWKADVESGYRISGESSGAFTLQSCATEVIPKVKIGEVCDPIEEGVDVNFELTPEDAGYFSVKDTSLGEVTQLQPGVAYLRNGSYTWSFVPRAGIITEIKSATAGALTITQCPLSTGAYVPPKPGTILFFRDGKLVDPIVKQGEVIALRLDVGGATGVTLERVGKDDRLVLGAMTRDGNSSRWLYVWNVGAAVPGEYSLVAHAVQAKGDFVPGSRLVKILPSHLTLQSISAITPPIPTVKSSIEFPDISLDLLPDEPLFHQIQVDESTGLTLPVRGVADLISTKEILSVGENLPPALRSPEDLRIFCATADHDDICLGLLPDDLREEAEDIIAQARNEILRAFAERPPLSVDTDQDGLSDYDETHFFGTNANQADSDKDGVLDQIEMLQNRNPLSSKGDALRFENPSIGGVDDIEHLSVDSVRATDESQLSTSTPLVISGKAFPNTLVTIYVFSDPTIIRVNANAEGQWTAPVTSILSDGEHHAFVAVTDSVGRILAKSTPRTFFIDGAKVSVTPQQTRFSGYTIFSHSAMSVLAVFFLSGAAGLLYVAYRNIIRRRRGDTAFL